MEDFRYRSQEAGTIFIIPGSLATILISGEKLLNALYGFE